ncbi:Hypothetical predicted protein [Olea europaea subsp. europaea]|uniref:Uncharacterized protein n=1 Tax=Olea europaea subsp. europaea TaxID=158383 RepID=A0A8S0T661_OLEEU|nr:Hypothetical predicted protein [Olea europaea subsp. europaea]
MSEAGADTVTVDIDDMLSLSSPPSKPSLFRVGDHLRSINPENLRITIPDAYEPELIAIGPFHIHKRHLQKMQQHKFRYLYLLLQRTGESSVERYVTTVRQLEDRARKYYAEDINLDKNEFVKMLILDGCFIIEFLYMFQDKKCRDEDDYIFQYEHITKQLLHDLMVFENQIPFFIVDSLFKMIKRNNGDNIESLIYNLLQNSIFPLEWKDLPNVTINGPHLLGIVHDLQCSSFATILSQVNTGSPVNMVNIHSAVELEKTGVSFEESESNVLFHIVFENKAMKIPKWEISDSTESLFRNLIAYEHYYTGSSQKYVTEYVFFMHCLVRSPEDAAVLERSKIISNLLGSYEMVHRVINLLGKNIIISGRSPYFRIFSDVSDHCAKIRNTWIATLKREYFNSPWTAISVFAAIILLGLTIIQTACSILSLPQWSH